MNVSKHVPNMSLWSRSGWIQRQPHPSTSKTQRVPAMGPAKEASQSRRFSKHTATTLSHALLIARQYSKSSPCTTCKAKQVILRSLPDTTTQQHDSLVFLQDNWKVLALGRPLRGLCWKVPELGRSNGGCNSARQHREDWVNEKTAA